jgi:2,3-bisphosphoglycerate-independent phosphoglycerate mutase
MPFSNSTSKRKKSKEKPRVLLCILDGFGHAKNYKGNAITRAKTPFINKLKRKHPWTLLKTHGEAVGIPKGNQGGSEVGHFTIGAGRIVEQPLLKINNSIKSGKFFKKKDLLAAIKHVKKNKSALHILGMISDQGVHSNIHHGLALLELAKRKKVKKVYFHAITDGRDVEPKSAERFVKMVQKKIRQLDFPAHGGHAQIATIIGRYYAMDRDKNLKRTQVAYELLTKGKGRRAKDPITAIKAQYQGKYGKPLESDYYLKPIVLTVDAQIKKQDAIICFNFRSDRTKQITDMLTKKTYFVAFGPYTKKAPVVFPAPVVKNNLAQVLAKNKRTQLRIAETEKYAHVTFFFNSQNKQPVQGEKRILVGSPKCPSYAEQPEMSAPEVTDRLLKEIPKHHDFIALNFANPDLVGHSGDVKAAIKAVETLDKSLAKIVPLALQHNYTILITADHGNAEFMTYPDGSQCASHSTNPVPFILVSTSAKDPSGKPLALKKSSHARATAGLQSLAPSILKLMRIKKPRQMTGESLV